MYTTKYGLKMIIKRLNAFNGAFPSIPKVVSCFKLTLFKGTAPISVLSCCPLLNCSPFHMLSVVEAWLFIAWPRLFKGSTNQRAAVSPGSKVSYVFDWGSYQLETHQRGDQV